MCIWLTLPALLASSGPCRSIVSFLFFLLLYLWIGVLLFSLAVWASWGITSVFENVLVAPTSCIYLFSIIHYVSLKLLLLNLLRIVIQII